jgi:hypothetical protein
MTNSTLFTFQVMIDGCEPFGVARPTKAEAEAVIEAALADPRRNFVRADFRIVERAPLPAPRYGRHQDPDSTVRARSGRGDGDI